MIPAVTLTLEVLLLPPLKFYLFKYRVSLFLAQCEETFIKIRISNSFLLFIGCLVRGTIAHELIHALGFYHEQSRPDRDDFLTLDRNNIQPGMKMNT